MARRRKTLLGLLVWLLPLLLTAGLAPFQFAFLSDTHVGSSSGAEDLRLAVNDLNAMSNLSFVVISGDITEYGSREQLRLAREILDGLKLPCHVIPGNHDTKWSESGATDFRRLWEADRFVFENGGLRFIGMHQGPLMKMGDGHWSPQDVRWLRDTLAALPDQRQPLVFITHYPLDQGIDNWFVVLDLLKQYNTQIALCGHGHANRPELFEGLPGVMGRSNLRGNREAGGFNIVEVKDGAMTFAEHLHGQPTKTPWLTVPLRPHDFAADTNSYPRPDFAINARFSNIQDQWAWKGGWTIASTPAQWRDRAIFGDASGTLYALALKSGHVDWKFKAGNAVYCSPAVGGDLVVIASTDGNIYALKGGNGKEAWRCKTDRPIVASPAIADGVVYLGSSEGKSRALDLASGRLRWEYDGVGGFVETRALIHEGKVIFGAWDQHLYALDARTGRLLWRWKGDRSGTLYSPAACWPVAAAGKVFIVAPDRRMTAIDAKTGSQLWRTSEYSVRESIGLSEDRSRLYVRAMQDFFYAFSTGAARPEKLWETKADFGYDINSGMLVEKDGVVFFGTKNGVLFALDGRQGALKWEHKIGTGIVNTVLPLSARGVLATDADGTVVLIEESGRQTAVGKD